MLCCRYSSVSFGGRTRPQNLNWTTFCPTSAEFGHFTSPSQPRARHEPSSSQAQMLLFFCFLFWVSWPRKSNKHFYINCRNNLKGTMKYVIRNYALRSWRGKALVEELVIICFTSFCHLVNSKSWNWNDQTIDRNKEAIEITTVQGQARNHVFLRGGAIQGGGGPNETGEASL